MGMLERVSTKLEGVEVEGRRIGLENYGISL